MPRRSCRLWSTNAALSVGILASACSPTARSNSPADPPASQPAAPAKDVAASKPALEAPPQSTRPATFQESIQVIDLRSFPMLKEGEVYYRNVAKVGYALAEPKLADDVGFYKNRLVAAGWKVDSEDVKAADSYGCLKFTKNGFYAAVDIVKNPNNGKMMAFVQNHGNVDVRTLPRFPASKTKQCYFYLCFHEADGKVDDVAKFIRDEYKKLGWRPTLPYGMPSGSIAGKYYNLGFMQGAIRLQVTITDEDGKSEVNCSASVMMFGVPFHPDATGSIELDEDPKLRMFYSTRASAKDVLAFYRGELPKIGWTIDAGPGEVKDHATVVALEAPGKVAMRLEVLEKGPICYVQIVPANATTRRPE